MNNHFKKETSSRFSLPLGCLIYPVLIALVLGAAGYFVIQKENDNSALAATKEWAQLNDFPATATNLRIETGGNMFTRKFTVEFDAPLVDIETWLNVSPGTKAVSPRIDGNIRRYSIEPGGGAQHAELELDEASNHVKIFVYWS